MLTLSSLLVLTDELRLLLLLRILVKDLRVTSTKPCNRTLSAISLAFVSITNCSNFVPGSSFCLSSWHVSSQISFSCWCLCCCCRRTSFFSLWAAYNLEDKMLMTYKFVFLTLYCSNLNKKEAKNIEHVL